MDNKILLQNLAEALAARTGMTKRKADTFVRAFFDLAEEGLTTESILKIKGFATFKIVTVSDRESVNINTGERFQIIGHEKISFLPDNAFKELVNRPFNHFTTINLDDDFDISELDSVTDAIIVAVLGLVGTLAGSYLANRKSAALVAYRLEQLEQKVNKHNNLIERTYALEESVALMDERVKVANHRIADLEKVHRIGQDGMSGKETI